MLIRISAVLLLAAATPSFAEEIACEGAFGMDSSEERLIEIYGAENVVTGEVPGPEGTTMIATRVFPDNRKKEMTFSWWDEENHTDLANVDLPPKIITPGGVEIGLTVAEIEERNGGPFEISGFGWDYGGYANFEGGDLAELPGDCVISVRFFLPDEYPASIEATALMGDGVTVPSSEPLLKDLDVRVSAVSLGYAHPDYR